MLCGPRGILVYSNQSRERIKDGGWKRMSAGEMSAGDVALTIGVHGLYSLIVVYDLPQLLY